ncbi:MAG TPA: cytochrome c [Steroidobacteraceae bacterium]|nr:cytochrome c [Steroidobacteraceae bacterium]
MRQIALRLIGACALAGMAIPAAAEEPKGSEVFEYYCSHCHGPGDAPGTVQLSRTRGNDKGLLTQRTDLAPEYIEYIVRHGLKSMPPFAPSDLTEARLKALIGFLTKQETAKK